MRHLLSLCLPGLLLSSCATEHLKVRTDWDRLETSLTEPHAVGVRDIYLVGDAGQTAEDGFNPVLQALGKALDTAQATSWAVFLGDNVYPNGVPSDKEKPRAYGKAIGMLDAQVGILRDFAGTPLFIPGNHDWYSRGPIGLKRQEKYLEETLDNKEVFQPENGCGFEKIEVDESLTILVIDSQWFIADWDRYPGINRECQIRDREGFFEEVESEIKKHRDRTTLILLHNPVLNYGAHAGQYSLHSHLFPFHSPIPLPILGTLINELRRTTGVSHADQSHPRYRELSKRLMTLAQFSERVVLASGHEHGLQYIVENNTPQIISGSGAKRSANRLMGGSHFATGQGGFVRLQLFDDGSSWAHFYTVDDQGTSREVFQTSVLPPWPLDIPTDGFDTDILTKAQFRASVYKPDEVSKGWVYRKLWGDRYRNGYASEVEAEVAQLDTLYGGLRPIREGGGHQSYSLRLLDKQGKPYVMRALRKSAEKYLQAIAFQDQFMIGQFEGTATERFLLDFYTGSHPYAPFTVEPLARALGISHTRPRLFYVPRQPALGPYNTGYGDELYMIEEHVSSPHADLEHLGGGDRILSTMDLLDELRSDSEHSIDVEAFVRARLFDMLLGDWDRHPDQWRWSRHKLHKDSILYRPIPRDRDQVYSRMGDGLIMGVGTRLLPALRLFEGFAPKIRSVTGFNSSPKTYALDMALLSGVAREIWEEQARFIQEALTEEVIEEGLDRLPPEVREPELMEVLIQRKKGLLSVAREYHRHLNRRVILAATEKDEHIALNSDEGLLEVQFSRIKDGKLKSPFAHYLLDPDITQEVWIYGLDDADRFEVLGTPRGIRVRLIGGPGEDSYRLPASASGIHLYEHTDEENNFAQARGGRIHRRKDYRTNTYRISDVRADAWQLLPAAGANPDDGLRLGLTTDWTGYGLVQNPYSSRHRLQAHAYLATSGWDWSYRGEKAGLLGRWNLEWGGRFTSPNYSLNFFGLGNASENPEDEVPQGLDFNRVRIQQLQLGLGSVRRGKLGSELRVGTQFQSFRVADNEGRFIEDYLARTNTGNRQEFISGGAAYRFTNYDSESNPSVGFLFELQGHYYWRLNREGGFGSITQRLGYIRSIVPDGRLVFATDVFANWNIGRDYEFYQAASLGGRTGLRGYRFQRFSGQTAFSQSTDLRWRFRSTHGGLFPTRWGLFLGYDYGRVWLAGDPPSGWHHSAGGGFTLSAADVFTFRAGAFGGEDGLRLAFSTGASW